MRERKPRPRPFWTADRIEALRQLATHPDRLSSGKISKIMGVTRMAVCGQCARRGFALANAVGPGNHYVPRRIYPPKPPKQTREKGKEIMTKPKSKPLKPQKMPVEALFEPTDLIVPDQPREAWVWRAGAALAHWAIGDNQCHWPIGEVTSDDFHFCAQPSMVGVTPNYCLHHHALASRTGVGSPALRKALGHRLMIEKQG